MDALTRRFILYGAFYAALLVYIGMLMRPVLGIAGPLPSLLFGLLIGSPAGLLTIWTVRAVTRLLRRYRGHRMALEYIGVRGWRLTALAWLEALTG